MTRNLRRNPVDLPQVEDTWLLAVRRLRTWIAPDEGDLGDAPIRPFLTLIFNRTQNLIRGINLSIEPTPQDVQKNLFTAMTKPQKESRAKPERPTRIIFNDPDLQHSLAPALQEIGIQSTYLPKDHILDELVQQLEADMRNGQPEIAGLLSVKKTTVKILAAFFNAASGFYRSAPWVHLGNEDFLAVRVRPQTEPWFLSIMGQGGVEYGLALYKTWSDVERMHASYDHPLEVIPEEGGHSLLFNDAFDVPFDDLDDIEKYGWSIPGSDAYPTPMIFMPSGEAGRPDVDEILWYEAVLRAIPDFVRDHLKESPDGKLQPVEANITVLTSAGSKSVEIKFPAGELHPDTMTASDLLRDWDEPDEAAAPFDRRIMEGKMAQLHRGMGQNNIDPKVRDAQDLIYEAWDEQNPAKRLSLARQALRVSADCADAYVLLAEEEASSVKQALDYYQMGVSAGERTLGPRYLKKNAGDFWDLLETRPYMRALAGKAGCLWEMHRKEEALGVYQEMLHLNPNDNQGVRYLLVDLYLMLNRGADLAKLIRKYKGDWSTVWLFTQALLEFRENGPSVAANRRLRDAQEQNRHVIAYLTGKKRVPSRLPDLIEWGGDSEAVEYASAHLNHWRRTPGAVEWLLNQKPRSRNPARRAAGGDRKKQTTRK